MNQLEGLVQQLSGGSAPPEEVERGYEQVSQAAPRQEVAGGLASAFRSDETPPFPNMVANLFANSSGEQRAGVLNQLLGAVGGSGALGGLLGGGLGGLLSGGHVTPDQAKQVPPEAVEQIAKQAEQQDPSVIDRVSDFYAEHPTLVKALGAAALMVAVNHMGRRR